MKIIIKKETEEGIVLDSLSEFPKIESTLKDYGISVAQIPLNRDNEFSSPYESFVEHFKLMNKYISSDIVRLSKETPKEVLDPFKKVHHHTDDEVRFTIDGEGVFGIIPDEKTEIEIYCTKGDLINIPAYTRHWFKLTKSHEMNCVRIFKDNPKWEAIYNVPENQALTKSLLA